MGYELEPLSLATIVILGSIWSLFQRDTALKWCWALRVLTCFSLMLIYEAQINRDSFFFFDQIKSLKSAPDFMPYLFQGNANFVFWNYWLTKIPLLGSYHSLRLLYSLLGLVGGWLLFRAVCATLGPQKNCVLILLTCFPSILFWTSTFSKDSLVFFFSSLFIYGLFQVPRNKKHLWSLVIGLLMVASLRVWVAYGLFLAGSVFLVMSLRRPRAVWMTGLCLSHGLFIVHTVQSLHLFSTHDILARINAVSQSWNHGGSGQILEPFTSVQELIAFLPIGFFTALFRPLPGEITSFWGWSAGIENLALLVAVVWALTRNGLRSLSVPVLAFCSVAALYFGFLYAFLSYQNLGTAFRFKMQFLCFLLIPLIYAWQDRKESIRAPG